MTLDSDQLLLLAGQGDRDAMGEVYRRHKPQVVSFFRHMRATGDQPEDLAQEVFMRIWSSAHRYKPSGKHWSFIFTVAANVWKDHRRRLKVRADAPESNARAQTLPDGASARAEFRQDFERALDTLPEHERMAFILSEIQGLSYREIARIMRCRVGTVGSRKTRAIRQLRRLLVDHAPEGYRKEVENDEMSARQTSPGVS
jgi:RNA polymerase sigma-70 factor (ECF subfamily)